MAPGDDLIMSNIYSLLNYVASTSKEIHDVSHNIPPSDLFSGLNGGYTFVNSDCATLRSIDAAAPCHTEEEGRLITTSTISVVSRLALEFKGDEVGTSLASKQSPT